MERNRDQSCDRIVDYVKQGILHGELFPGDKLPPERELAEQLGSSRNSVREGLKVLQNMGVISASQGSGNYISQNFQQTISEVLSFLYFLNGMDEAEVTEYRWMIEKEALDLAVKYITEEQKEQLKISLAGLNAAKNEEKKIQYDKQLHHTMVLASQNTFLIANYEALTEFMDKYIETMRQKIIRGMESSNELEYAHRLLVEGLTNHDLNKARLGLENHFGYIETYKNI